MLIVFQIGVTPIFLSLVSTSLSPFKIFNRNRIFDVCALIKTVTVSLCIFFLSFFLPFSVLSCLAFRYLFLSPVHSFCSVPCIGDVSVFSSSAVGAQSNLHFMDVFRAFGSLIGFWCTRCSTTVKRMKAIFGLDSILFVPALSNGFETPATNWLRWSHVSKTNVFN